MAATLKILAIVVVASIFAAECAADAQDAAKPKGESGLSEKGTSLMSTRGYLNAVNTRMEKLVEIFEDHSEENLLAEEDVQRPAATKKEHLLEPSQALLKQIGADFDEEALLEIEPTAGASDADADAIDAAKAVETPAYYTKLVLQALIAAVLAHIICTWQQRQAEAKDAGETPKVSAEEVSAFLLEAVCADDADRCMALLDSSDVLNVDLHVDAMGCNLLHTAAHHGSAAVAKLLLARGATVDATDAWDQTPLHFAARAGSSEVCALLVDQGAALDAKDAQDCTPLLIGAKANKVDACRFLLERGAGTGGVAEEQLPPMLSMLLLQRIFNRPFPTPSVKMEYEDDKSTAEGDATDDEDWNEEKNMEQ